MGVILGEGRVLSIWLFGESVDIKIGIEIGVRLFVLVDNGVKPYWEWVKTSDGDNWVVVGSKIGVFTFV